MGTWDMIAHERRALADELAGLDETQWSSPSALPGWTVRHVAAHVVWPIENPRLTLLRALARERFSLVRMVDVSADAERRPPSAVAEALRRHAHKKMLPAQPVSTGMAEILVHGFDIRWALKRAYVPAAEHVRIALNFLASPVAPRAFRPRRLLPGLRFECPEAGWSAGSGPTVRGSAAAMLLSLCNRTAALEEVEGDGVTEFRSRFRARR